jgi:hypothetical protein
MFLIEINDRYSKGFLNNYKAKLQNPAHICFIKMFIVSCWIMYDYQQRGYEKNKSGKGRRIKL